ncbi:CoA transferase subunit A [Deltaproteobacteria bacterium OttesenSCG-928-K17]|nr:CoA transferase subunit A [Deltaproteobacteria bacterium OttesenSCG-928-K17]
MKKLISLEQAVDQIKSGSTVMIGGFMNCGTPPKLMAALAARDDIKDLTVISNDHSMTGVGISKLVAARKIKKAIATHLGLNPETGTQMDEGFMDVTVMPQGTFAERIRCGGAGLGGVLTPTGVGTVIEEGKQKIVLDGITYLLERPLRADVALLLAHKGDKFGNLFFRRATKTFQPMMAMAADVVIAEVENLSDEALDPDMIHTPGILVKHMVQG